MNLRAWIEQSDPGLLLSIGDDWIAFGAELEQIFDAYVHAVTQVGDGYWEGACAEAAQSRANADRNTMRELADKIETVANLAKAGYDEISAPLLRARGALAEADRHNFVVNILTLNLMYGPRASRSDAAAAAKDAIQAELHSAVAAAMGADVAVRDALNAATADLRASFISAAALGADQGRSDGAAVITDPENLTPEQKQRLIEAATLTPDQRAALERGETATIPASQMEYLTQLSQSLDGKSPKEIEQIVNKMPPETRTALANSLNIVSTPGIAAGPVANGDKDLPNSGRGGLNQLPASVRQSLTRPDLVTKETKYGLNEEVRLNGVADNQAIANVMKNADPQYQLGSDIDRAMLDVGAQYLDAYADYKDGGSEWYTDTSLVVDDNSNNSDFFTKTGLRISEDLFLAAGQDKAAVHDLVTGENGTETLGNILTHNWTDDGAAASTLFSFDPADATIENHSDPADVARAERTAEIMGAMGSYIAGDDIESPEDRWKQLTTLDPPNRTVAAMNPALIQALDTNMAPYAAVLAGENPANIPNTFAPREQDGANSDFRRWIDPLGDESYQGSKNVFGLLGAVDDPGVISETECTPPRVSQLQQRALQSMYAELDSYAADPGSVDGSGHLDTAGRLRALIDNGLLMSATAEANGEYLDAKTEYDRRGALYEMVRGYISMGATAGPGPTGDIVANSYTAAAESWRPSFQGPEPEPGKVADIVRPDIARLNHAILANVDLSPADKEIYAPLFDDNGMLRSWENIDADPDHSNLKSKVQTLFSTIGRPGDNSAFGNSYDRVTSPTIN